MLSSLLNFVVAATLEGRDSSLLERSSPAPSRQARGLAAVCLGLLTAACPSPHAPGDDGASSHLSSRACLAAGLADLTAWRWIEPRLSGAFAWSPCTHWLPAGHLVARTSCLSPHPFAAAVSFTPEGCDDPGDRHVQALRTLLLAPDRGDDVVEMLQDLAGQASGDTAVLSDLAAAWMLRAELDDEPVDLLRAEDAARAATGAAVPPPAARWNLALAEEGLDLAPEATVSWRRYLQEPGGSAWSREASLHLRGLERAEALAAAIQWPLNRRRIEAAWAAGERADIVPLVAPFPAAAQRWIEDDLLPAWARLAAAGGAPARERLGLAWEVATALRRTTGDPYMSEAVQGLRRAVERRGDARLAVLRRALLAFGEARAAETAREPHQAEIRYRQAMLAFAAAGSPLAATARLGLALALFYQNATVPPERVLDVVADLAPSARRRGHLQVAARAHWLRALCLSFASHPLESLADYDEALRTYQGMHDGEDAASVLARKSGVLREIGQDGLAWRQALTAEHGAGSVVDLQSRHYIHGEAAQAALAAGFPAAALLYQQRAVRLIEDDLAAAHAATQGTLQHLRGNLAIALRARAGIFLHLGLLPAAGADLEQATGLTKQRSDGDMEHALMARVHEVNGQRYAAAEPRRAIAELSAALQLSPGENRTFRASLHFERARAAGLEGDRAAEEADLRAGIGELQAEQQSVVDVRRPGKEDEILAGYFSRFHDAYQLLVSLLAAQGRQDEAFAFVERARAYEPLQLVLRRPTVPAGFQRLVANGAPLALPAVEAELPVGTVILEYAVQQDRTLVWAIWHGGHLFLATPAGGAVIAGWTRTLQREARKRLPEAFAADLAKPYAALVGEPLTHLQGRCRIARLVFVPDGAIHGLPMAALRGPRGRYLVQDFPVAVAPSASLYVYSLLRNRQVARGASGSVLLVGDPAFDSSLDVARGLARLPRADDEIAQIGALYPRGEPPLRRSAATIDAFLAGARTAAVVHFAGHALVNPSAPFRSLLLLAPSAGRSGALTAEDLVAHLEADRARLFVLGTCSSAGGYPIGPEGLAALVRPVIGAGVPAVLASLWNVGDSTTVQLMVQFHRHFAAGEDAASALRLAQLDLLDQPGGGAPSVLAWAPWEVIGEASSPFPNRNATSGRVVP